MATASAAKPTARRATRKSSPRAAASKSAAPEELGDFRKAAQAAEAAAAHVSDGVAAQTERLRQKGAEWVAAGKDSASQAIDRAKQHPWLALGIAVAAGAVLAACGARRRR